MKIFTRHKENLTAFVLGAIVIIALNVLMLHYHYDPWTNPKAGFWSAFWNRFEISGFDSYSYIVISKWRPLFVLSRHPLLAVMLWPLSQLNAWLMEATNINCSIFIVAVVWGAASLCSWMLMHQIIRRFIGLGSGISLLLTAYFYSFSHVMLTIFVPDHMTLSLLLLMTTIYLAAKAIHTGRPMPLWQSLLMALVSTGVTTTNIVKVAIADFFTQLRHKRSMEIVTHFMAYLIPVAIIAGAYYYQLQTTQIEEKRYAENIVRKRSMKDSAFAEKIRRSKESHAEIRSRQLIDLDVVTNTEYHIDRLPSLVENIFGEGFILHKEHALKDANRMRPVLVHYDSWHYYAVEAAIVVLFLAGVWFGRRERLMWITGAMFLFDMLLHVGLNFASADVYIMTAHWAFVVPVATAYLLKHTARHTGIQTALIGLIVFLTAFMWMHNVQIIAQHIL